MCPFHEPNVIQIFLRRTMYQHSSDFTTFTSVKRTSKPKESKIDYKMPLNMFNPVTFLTVPISSETFLIEKFKVVAV